jgi:hypothetical protein
MTKLTKAERSTAAKKAAATRKRNETKSGATELKRAAGNALDAAKDLGAAAAGAAKGSVKAVAKR